MARHRHPRIDQPREDDRLPDGDVVPVPGHRRWVDLLPATNPDPPAELFRPYVTEQEGRRWPRS
jgi:hypothetical protein